MTADRERLEKELDMNRQHQIHLEQDSQSLEASLAATTSDKHSLEAALKEQEKVSHVTTWFSVTVMVVCQHDSCRYGWFWLEGDQFVHLNG